MKNEDFQIVVVSSLLALGLTGCIVVGSDGDLDVTGMGGHEFYACNSSASPFGGGSGTASDPYTICSISHFDQVRNYSGTVGFSETYFVLATSIDFNYQVHTPISYFFSHFDGNGYSISNYYLAEGVPFVGLFGSIANTGSVKNLNILNGNAYLNPGGTQSYGLLAGTNQGSISYVNASGNLYMNTTDPNDDLGGLVGHNEGTISYSNSGISATIGTNAFGRIGGIAGRNGSNTYTAVIENAIANISILGDMAIGGSVAGGIAGINGLATGGNGYINYSNSSGYVQGGGGVGGIAGLNYGVITYASSDATVYAEQRGGGIAGTNYNSIGNSHSDADVATLSGAGGGIVGSQEFAFTNPWLTDSTASSNAQVFANAGVSHGGAVGRLYAGNLQNVYSTATVSGNGGGLGGLIGDLYDGTSQVIVVQNCGVYVTNISSTGSQVGGLIGYMSIGSNGAGTIVRNIFSQANVNGANQVGGLVGYYSGYSPNTVEIERAHVPAFATITGQSEVGGLVGTAYSGRVYRSATNATVMITGFIGGPAGGMFGRLESGSNVHDSYSRSAIINVDDYGGHTLGGFAGFAAGSNIYDSYYSGDITDSSQTTTPAGTYDAFIGSNSGTNVFNTYFNLDNIGGSSAYATGCFTNGFVNSGIGCPTFNLGATDAAPWVMNPGQYPKLYWEP